MTHLQGTRVAGRTAAFAGDMVTTPAVLTATNLCTLLTITLGRTDLGTFLARIALGALALAAEGFAGRVIQAIALQLAVDAIETRRAICRRVSLALSLSVSLSVSLALTGVPGQSR